MQFLQFNEFHPSSNYEIVEISMKMIAIPYWPFLKMFDIRKAVAPPFQRRPIQYIPFVHRDRRGTLQIARRSFSDEWIHCSICSIRGWVGYRSLLLLSLVDTIFRAIKRLHILVDRTKLSTCLESRAFFNNIRIFTYDFSLHLSSDIYFCYFVKRSFITGLFRHRILRSFFKRLLYSLYLYTISSNCLFANVHFLRFL